MASRHTVAAHSVVIDVVEGSVSRDQHHQQVPGGKVLLASSSHRLDDLRIGTWLGLAKASEMLGPLLVVVRHRVLAKRTVALHKHYGGVFLSVQRARVTVDHEK